MADPYLSGLSFTDMLHNHIIPGVARVAQAIASPVSVAQNAAAPAADATAATGADFLRGALGLGRPSVTVQLPAARGPAAAAPAAKAEASSAPQAKPAAAPKGKAAAAADPMADAAAALGKLSFRQILALSQASENLQPRGVVKEPTTADQAGNLLIQMTMPTFQNSLKAAKDDAAKQKVIDDYQQRVLLPIISHGNPMAGMFDQGGVPGGG